MIQEDVIGGGKVPRESILYERLSLSSSFRRGIKSQGHNSTRFYSL